MLLALASIGIKMKKLSIVLLVNMVVLFLAGNLYAARAWIGETKIEKISFVKSNGYCSPTGGACLLLYFESGARGCDFIAIRESDIHFKHIESMAFISYTAGKKFRVYASDEFCNNADAIAINNVQLY